jgi:uncharacterized membrane protein
MAVVSERSSAPPAGRVRNARAEGGEETFSARHRLDAWTLGIASFFAVALSVLAGLRHYQFGSSKYNLGNFTQAIWNTAHGRLFEATADTGDQMVRLGAHVEPILVLFAPLWWLWPSPLMLLTVQAVALASGALPVYWLARRRLGSTSAARLLAVSYLLYPSVALLALHEFHAVTLAIPFLLYAAWYLDADRILPFAVWAALAASTKEQIGLAVAGLGVWYVLTRRRYRMGTLIAASGLAWSAFAFLVVVPHFSPGGANPYSDRYAAVGGSPGGIVETALSSPQDILNAIATPANAAYVVALVLPVAGLCLLAPLALIPALPELAINLLSGHGLQKTLTWQYVAGIVPFLFLATIHAIRKRPQQTEFLTRIVAMAAAVTFALFTPQMFSWFGEPTNRASARQALSLIPDAVPVSVSGRLGAHLAERRRLLSFPTVREANWIIVDRRDAWIPWPVERWDPERWERAVGRYEHSHDWRVVFDRDDILVLRRRAPESEGPLE